MTTRGVENKTPDPIELTPRMDGTDVRRLLTRHPGLVPVMEFNGRDPAIRKSITADLDCSFGDSPDDGKLTLRQAGGAEVLSLQWGRHQRIFDGRLADTMQLTSGSLAEAAAREEEFFRGLAEMPSPEAIETRVTTATQAALKEGERDPEGSGTEAAVTTEPGADKPKTLEDLDPKKSTELPPELIGAVGRPLTHADFAALGIWLDREQTYGTKVKLVVLPASGKEEAVDGFVRAQAGRAFDRERDGHVAVGRDENGDLTVHVIIKMPFGVTQIDPKFCPREIFRFLADAANRLPSEQTPR
ncbi:hypothetical protein CO046_00155 [Candidatus Peregrinibacteria bacterium CG_4_9_14_0_2_um_filter_53_11]|nr:MAG: hypothetical protein CO046_00155 [Candidatus Peregrinibacteria bacterium CG_4_9_14_0_2_um_filter_53_11]